MLAKVRVEAGLTGTLQQISSEIAEMYARIPAAGGLAGDSQPPKFSGRVARRKWRSFGISSGWILAPARLKRYLDDFPGEFVMRRAKAIAGRWSLWTRKAIQSRALARRSGPVEGAATFQSLIAISFVFGGEWRGRIFIFDPAWQGRRRRSCASCSICFARSGPAVYNVYLLHRLRRRAGAAERARFARELHDGAVQSLIAVEMQVDVLRRQAETTPAVVGGELGRIQGLLREEVLKLRELMQQMKSIDVDSRRLLSVITDAVERFQRETGISARFVTDIDKTARCPTKFAANCCALCRRGW